MLVEKHHIQIQPDQVSVDGNLLDYDGSLKSIYKLLELDYPKFYKMDQMSKLGFLAVELLKTVWYKKDDFEDNLGLCFFNSTSCQESDLKYWNNVKQGKVNPSLFVYTLPNIVIGEITIRNKWYGESIFCIQNKTETKKVDQIIESWFKLKKAKYCIRCFLEYHDESHYFANLHFLLSEEAQ